MRGKAFISGILVISLLLTIASGFNKSDEAPANTKVETKIINTEAVNTEANKGNKLTTGYYTEELMNMPKAVQSGDEIVTEIVINPSGRLEVYTYLAMEDKNIQYTMNKDNTWKRTVPKWLNKGSQHSKCLAGLAYAPNGTKYALFHSSSQKMAQVLKSTDNQNAIDVTPQDCPMYAYPESIQILSDNSFLLAYLNECIIYKKGKISNSINTYGACYALSGKNILTASNTDNCYYIRNINSKVIINTLPLKNTSELTTFTSDSKGDFYGVNLSGIQRISKDGRKRETIIDGNQASMSNPSYHIKSIIPGSANDFYVLYDYETSMIAHYFYVKDIPLKSISTLQITSLYENETIRQAMADFNQTHRDIRVTYHPLICAEYGGIDEVMNILQSDNPPLLDGTDLLVMDDLLINTYIKKNVLADISNVVNPMVDSGELLNNIMDNYKTDEGKIYTVPIRYKITFAFGNKQAVESVSSINSLADYAKSESLPIFSCRKWDIMLFELYSNSILTEKGMDREGLVNFFTQLKIIYDHTIEPGDQDVPTDNSYFVSEDIFSNRSLLGLYYLNKTSDAYAPIAATDATGGAYSSVNNQYIPQGLIGINRSSAKKDLAAEFIKFLLSETYQSKVINDGFPVNTKALSNFGLKDNHYVKGYSDLFPITKPNNEKIQSIFELCKSVDTPIFRDRTLVNIVESGIRKYLWDYLWDNTDLDTTVDNVFKEVNTYLAAIQD